ncbi:restriction endonuclease subunit S [Corynebacterium sp. KPL2636]|uniref:restriction endonuclease subunit S n=1 Tax=Corynebacterium sp. KPL2636 TaxID=3158309 RepID=UPI0032ED8B9B
MLAGHGVSNEGNVHDTVWETKPLGEIIRVSSGKGLTAKEMAPGGTVPVYGGNGVTGYHDQSCYPAETITIGRVGFYCGSVHMTNEECWVTDNALVVHFNENEIDKKFLYFLLLHTNLRKNTSSSAQPLISGKKIYDILVRIPALDSQKVIAEGIENSLEKLDKIQHLVEGSKRILVQLRKQLIHHAFMGKVQ